MKLIHCDRLVGSISAVSQDGVWMSGSIVLEADLPDDYVAFFRYLTDELATYEEPPFDDMFLDASNWQIVTEDGVSHGIEVPAVHELDYIMWRWKEMNPRANQ